MKINSLLATAIRPRYILLVKYFGSTDIKTLVKQYKSFQDYLWLDLNESDNTELNGSCLSNYNYSLPSFKDVTWGNKFGKLFVINLSRDCTLDMVYPCIKYHKDVIPETVMPNLVYKPHHSIIALRYNYDHNVYRVDTMEEMYNLSKQTNEYMNSLTMRNTY